MRITTMLKQFIVVLFIMFSLVSAQAQNPGYLGKHLQVYAIAEPGIGFRGLSSNDMFEALQFEYDDAFEVNERIAFEVPIGLGAEYTCSSRITLGSNIRFIKTEVLTNAYETEIDGESYTYIGEVQNKGTLFGYYIKVYTTKKHGSIGPIGRYNKYEVITGRMQTSSYGFHTLDTRYLSSPTTLVDDFTLIDDEPTKILLLRYTLGSENVYFDHLVLDIGFQISATLFNLTNEELLHFESYYTSPAYILDNAAKGLQLGIVINPGYFVF